jgi:8-oxo-dGTP diphosphatase
MPVIVSDSTSMARPIVEVAAGILLDTEGRYLLGQRPPGKPYAGYWEVPGGKIEAGETVFIALQRELQEELGIQIEAGEELMVLDHAYAHAHVRLHVSIIRQWHGTPQGCEGQNLSWELLTHPQPLVSPLLPAAWPMLERLRQHLVQ